MIEAVIWDLDGVLVDSIELRLAGLRHAAEVAGVSPPGEPDLRRWLSHGPREALGNIPGANTSLRNFEGYCRRVAKHHVQGFLGIDEALSNLRQEGFRQGLVTSRTAADTDLWLAMCDLSSAYFNVMITHSDRLPSKPYPGGLLAAADRLGSNPSKCIYIGDTIVDGIASKRAGMRFLLAGWGHPTKAQSSLRSATRLSWKTLSTSCPGYLENCLDPPS